VSCGMLGKDSSHRGIKAGGEKWKRNRLRMFREEKLWALKVNKGLVKGTDGQGMKETDLAKRSRVLSFDWEGGAV